MNAPTPSDTVDNVAALNIRRMQYFERCFTVEIYYVTNIVIWFSTKFASVVDQTVDASTAMLFAF